MVGTEDIDRCFMNDLEIIQIWIIESYFFLVKNFLEAS